MPTSDAAQADLDEARRLERAADRWHAGRTAAIATAAVAVAGSIAGIAVVGTRSVQITDAKFDLESEEHTATDDSIHRCFAHQIRRAQKCVASSLNIDS